MTPWLNNRKHYICKAYDIFTSYPKFWIAFYETKQQGANNYVPDKHLWLLNPLFVNKTVKPKPDGNAYKRIWYLDDFKAIQTGAPTSCEQP
jgi:hypothetical protein